MRRPATYHRKRVAKAGSLRALVCLVLAAVLVLAFVPVGALAGLGSLGAYGEHVAFADNGNADGKDKDDGKDDEAVQKEEADRKAAKAVDDLIAALPNRIGVDDEGQIQQAQDAYDGLTNDQKAYVTRASELADAWSALEQAKQEEREKQEQADREAAQKVDKKIGALPKPSEIAKNDEAQITSVRAAYEALTDSQKAYVTRLAELEAAEKALAEAAEEPDKYYVKTLLLKREKKDGSSDFVGDSEVVSEANRKIKVMEFGAQVQLRGWYLSTDNTNVAYQTGSAETPIGKFDLDWKSSNTSIATVDNGLVTPHGKNGSVVITASVSDKDKAVYEGPVPTATVTIDFDGQDGKYVEKVEILDEAGAVIGSDWGGVRVFAEENAFHQLQARVTWKNVVDGTKTVEVTGSGQDYDASKVGTTITWNVSDSVAFTINKDTGRLKTGKYSGNAFVTCSVVGGLGGAIVEDTSNVQLDTGNYEYNPAETLTLRVVWEERPDEVVKEATYSLDDLASKLPSQHVNATVVNDTRYGVISAEGYLFKDVVDLVAVDDADVLQYRFGTADGYDNPVSYQYLFNSGNRYYFPNYDIGSLAEGQIVPPVLAYKSRFVWNKSEFDPSWQLDEATRFRLVFGCLASGDANTSFQIYYINTITIVLSGAPSAGDGNGTKSDTGTDNGSGGGQGGGKADGTGGKGHGKSGAGKGTTGSGGANGSGNLEGNNGNGQELAGAEESSGGADNTSGGETDVEGQTTEASDGADASPSKRWRVYQMMNKTNSDVPDWDDENPLSPFVAPLALGTFAIGAGATGIGFRRRLK